jgi:hypothetical protein
VCYCKAGRLAAGSSGYGFNIEDANQSNAWEVEQSYSRRVSNQRLAIRLNGDVAAGTKLHERRGEKISALGTQGNLG